MKTIFHKDFATNLLSKVSSRFSRIDFMINLVGVFFGLRPLTNFSHDEWNKKDTKFDRITSIVVFVLYSMPSFFIGVLLLYTFANPDTLTWVPISGIQDPTLFDPNWTFYEKASHRVPYFILPLITYTYSSFPICE